MNNILIYIPLLFSLACEDATYTSTSRCTIDITETPDVFVEGETATILAYPLTTDWDTVVEFDGVAADVEQLNKENCDTCESCRTENSCTECGYCADCQESCQECVHSLDVIVPTGLDSEVFLQVTNSQGMSDPMAISTTTATNE